MAYFSELPNIEYLSPFSNKDSNTTTILAKNIFKRAKIREDILKSITTFEYYTIRDNERPDQIAEKVYGDSELDWVILITNNITNIKNEWPLDNQSFHNYLIGKYGSNEAIYMPHHYETIETRDEFNRLVVPDGLNINPKLDINFTTNPNQKEYRLPHYPSKDLSPVVRINFIQALRVYKKDQSNIQFEISNIEGATSYFNVKKRDSDSNMRVKFQNQLTTWPSSWNGNLSIPKRGSGTSNVPIDDKISDISTVEVPASLYRIKSVGNIPSFSFFTLKYAPKTNVNISIKTKGYEVNYLDTKGNSISLVDRIKTITNYEYEEKLQNEKRNILILKPEYLSVFISDFKKIMRYDQSSQYINAKTKSVYNSNLTGV